MNKKLLTTILVCIGIPLVLYLVGSIGSGSFDPSGLGVSFFLAGALYFIPGLIISLIRNPSSRDIGKGMLLASALLILVGFSVCSMSSINFH